MSERVNNAFISYLWFPTSTTIRNRGRCKSSARTGHVEDISRLTLLSLLPQNYPPVSLHGRRSRIFVQGRFAREGDKWGQLCLTTADVLKVEDGKLAGVDPLAYAAPGFWVSGRSE
jgi:hypothetical protein